MENTSRAVCCQQKMFPDHVGSRVFSMVTLLYGPGYISRGPGPCFYLILAPDGSQDSSLWSKSTTSRACGKWCKKNLV